MTVTTRDGDRLGEVESLMIDQSEAVQYLVVRTGWFGRKRHAIPAQGLEVADDDVVVVPYTKDQLNAAPTLDDDDRLDYDRERTLGDHYGATVRAWDDSRDGWLGEEDLTRGPTPETRHPDATVDVDADTSQGPTPETRVRVREWRREHDRLRS